MSFDVGDNVDDSDILLTRIFVLILIIVFGSLVYFVKDKWFVAPNDKKSKRYKEDKYKDIDGC